MRAYVVKQGDYLRRLAHQLGFDADAVWSHPKNAELAKARPNREQLCPGDVLYLPDPAPPTRRVIPGTTNDYVANVPRVPLELVFVDGGKPIANEAYVAEGLDDPGPGTTDGEGKVRLEVPVSTTQFRILFPERELAHDISVGHMDPIDTDSGVRARLWNLGLLRRDDRSHDADALEHALRAFQALAGLAVTGILDDATRKKLGEHHE
jgi:hypothetical protein